ncbi:hypothetical protein BBM40_01085 [Vibrio parahaemolyticus]|uniref:hypothetical protein n=1 Tax=Vibrio parahaemolyticus TaxID=670 RepID=UPI00084AC3F3|nr:hypothetical protein [Vibrio parahaemolyticus]ODZ55725.1 hypothetical protein BBM40_01085 [Vibrio parahaemolyticus]
MTIENLLLQTDVIEDRQARLAIFNRVNAIADELEAQTEAPTSKLAEMLAAAAQQQEVFSSVALAEKSAQKTKLYLEQATPFLDEQGNKRQKRNLSNGFRNISVFKSASLKLCFISTDRAYFQKDYAQAIHHAKQHLSKRKKLLPLLEADDLVLEITSRHRVGRTLELAKMKLFDQLKEKGWEMLCNRPRVK